MKRLKVRLALSNPASFGSDRLIKAGVIIRDIQNTGEETCFWIDGGNLQKAEDILSESRIVYRIVEKRLQADLLSRHGIDVVIIPAIVLAITLCVWFSHISLDYSLTDTSVFNYFEISDMGRQCGIVLWSRVSENNLNALKSKIMSHSEVADCNVLKKGNKIVVQISPALTQEYIYEKDSALGNSSAYDAEVTKIILKSGTALVSVGDKVTRGQPLVGPYYEVGEQRYEVETDCLIYGRTTVEYSVVLGSVAIETSYDEYELQSIDFSIFNINLFSHVFRESSDDNMSVTYADMGVLPLKITKNYTRNRSESEVIVDENYIKDRLLQSVIWELEDKYGRDFWDVETDFSIKNIDNNIILVVYYTGTTIINKGG